VRGQPQTPTADDTPWTQPHKCGICGATWDCAFTLCFEPYVTTCLACKCGPMVCGWKEPFKLT